MMKKNLLIIIFYLLFCENLLAADKWNIIAIVPDDHSRRAMGIYGDKNAVTPNFDQLAREGVRFTNAYAAAPVCSPSRAAFFSGKYPSQVGVNDFLMLNEKYADKGLDKDVLLWPEILQDNGYKTGLIGKWHIGESEEKQPGNRGFDHHVSYNQDQRPFEPIMNVNGEIKEIPGHTSDIFVNYAKEFINENKNNKFALVMTFREPQMPWQAVPEIDKEAVKHIDPDVPNMPGVDIEWLKKMTKDNYAAIHALDRAVGDIIAEVDRLGLTEKTIILYAGDHGMLIGHHGFFGRGAVGAIAGEEVVGGENIANLYDEAIKIPFIIRWPGKTEQNIALDMPVSNVDVFPTILSMMGIDIPNSVKPEGRNLTSFLKGEEEDYSKPVFAQYNMRNFGIANLRMVRFENWKLVKRFNMGAVSELIDELYNLETDPNEHQNLIASTEHKGIREKLERMIHDWQVSIDDPAISNEM